jgi:hypothetical protein
MGASVAILCLRLWTSLATINFSIKGIIQCLEKHSVGQGDPRWTSLAFLTTIKECVAYRQTMNLAPNTLLCSPLVTRDVIELTFGTGVLHLIQINHQPDTTVFQFIILTFVYSSICFGRFPAHHQELNDCSSSLWFYLRIVVTVVLCSWSGRPDSTTVTTIRR